jgi:hypothetical protein
MHFSPPFAMPATVEYWRGTQTPPWRNQFEKLRLPFRVAESGDCVDPILTVQSHSSSAGLRP